MGKSQRDKGARVERLLVHTLMKDNFYNVHRVPLSGLAPGYKHDVVFESRQRKYSIECKARKCGFKPIYEFLFKNLTQNVFAYEKEGVLVAFGFNLRDVLHYEGIYSPDWHNGGSLTRRLDALDAMRAGADVLVLKDNNMPFIYIKISDGKEKIQC
jgi:hypothetical protein